MFVKIILMDWERTQVAAGTADCRRRFWIRAREPSAPHHGHPRGGTVAAEPSKEDVPTPPPLVRSCKGTHYQKESFNDLDSIFYQMPRGDLRSHDKINSRAVQKSALPHRLRTSRLGRHLQHAFNVSFKPKTMKNNGNDIDGLRYPLANVVCLTSWVYHFDWIACVSYLLLASMQPNSIQFA